VTTYLLAGGGTAGHVNPLLAVADALTAREPGATVLVLGTREGLEARLVPQRAYELLFVDKVPFPRRPDAAALRFPARFARAVRQVRSHIRERGVDVVVGFGGYASAPAYIAAGRAGVPVVVHEANAKPGLANVLGARRAAASGVAFEGTPLRGAEVVGMPLRPEIVHLDRAALRDEAATAFGLDADRPVLLVFGGSLGAVRINRALADSWQDVVAAGWQILHAAGERNDIADPGDPAYRPAVYVPYAVGNGEQALNAASAVAAGAAVLVPDAELSGDRIRSSVVPLLTDAAALDRMRAAATAVGTRTGSENVVALIDRALAR